MAATSSPPLDLHQLACFLVLLQMWNLSNMYGGPTTLTGHDGIVLALCTQGYVHNNKELFFQCNSNINYVPPEVTIEH